MNQILSEKRASSVMEYLARQNIPAASMTSQGFRQNSTRCIQRYSRRTTAEPSCRNGRIGRRNRHDDRGRISKSPDERTPLNP